jgi:hypothetical protein
MPTLDSMAALMDAAWEARQRGDWAAVDARVEEYRRAYEENPQLR